MASPDLEQLARQCYEAYATGERRLIEELLAENCEFYSPADIGIDRDRYFERCWPNAGAIERYELTRLVQAGDEVIVTYEATKTDGQRFRNTEVLTFHGGKLRKAEVYFGWSV